MRTHRVFPALQPWLWRTDLLRDLVRADRLVATRIEPIVRSREPAAFIDLHFSDGERNVTVPLVYLDLAQLDLRESDPLVFPHGIVNVVSDASASGVVERLLPELERRAFTGGFWTEDVIHSGAAPAFERARERGFFGAAPLAVALPRIAGAVYAQRFAAAKRVVAYGSDASEAAAFLRAGAQSCFVMDDAGMDASAWYGAFEAASRFDACDLAIGHGPAPVRAIVSVRLDAGEHAGNRFVSAAPLPADVMLSFDPADGAAAGEFSVVTEREPFTRPASAVELPSAARGSAGRIAIVVRPDAVLVPDADTDEAAALAGALRAEGFTAEVLHDAGALSAFAPDLVHLFGARPGGYARRVADWAGAARKPLVIQALHEAPAAGGYWGAMVAPYCFGYSADEHSVGTYLDLLARGAVEVDGVNATTLFAPVTAGLPEAERVLALADVVLVNSERERGSIAGLRARRPTYVVPSLPIALAEPAPVGAYVGSDPFILVHAPVGPEANQLMLARAAGEVGVPMVIAGAVADPAYAERLREFAPQAIVLLGEPSPGLVARLYRSAAVIADAAWTTRGHGRLVTAAAMGAALVCSQRRWLDLPEAGRWTVDPADVRSIARGLGSAWDAAARNEVNVRTIADLTRKHAQTAAAAIIAAYAKTVQAA
jgi:hypothetical protein